MSETAAPLAPGDIVQYRKVGTFRITERVDPSYPLDSRGGAWWYATAVKAPKKYRELSHDAARFYVGPANRV